MTHRTRDNDGETVTSKRKRTTNAVGRSPNRDEYAQLLKNGWSSVALEQYALFRYGEKIPASAFRTYRKRNGWEVQTSTMTSAQALDPDALLDLLHERALLIAMQKARIAIDVQHEQRMQKLFGSTRSEIQLLSQLLDQSKKDLQDLGLFPQVGAKVTIEGRVGALAPDLDDGRNRFTTPAASLGELVGQLGPAEEMRLARMIHEVLPGRNGNGSGPVVVEGG